MDKPLKIAIAGAGYVGLSNAMLLAQHGVEVIIYEPVMDESGFFTPEW